MFLLMYLYYFVSSIVLLFFTAEILPGVLKDPRAYLELARVVAPRR